MNMAYIPEEVMEQFKFESGFNKTFKPLMDAYQERKGTSSSAKSSSPLEKSHTSDQQVLKGTATIDEEEEDSGDEGSNLIKKNQ